MNPAELKPQLLEESDWRIRRLTARKLGQSTDAEASKILIEALEDPDPEVLAAVIASLTRLGEPAAATRLLRHKILSNNSALVRWMAVKALGKLGSHEVLETLSRMLDDKEWVVRNEARVALVERIRALESPHEPRNLSLLLRFLTAQDREVREEATAALGQTDPDHVGALVETLEMPSPMVREGVLKALGAIGLAPLLPTIIKASHDPSPEIRRTAAWAMGRIGDPRASMRLAELLDDHVGDVAAAAMEAIAQGGEAMLGSLLAALKFARSAIGKANILKVLARLHCPASLPKIIEHMADGRFMVRNAATRAAIVFGEEAVKPLIAMLQVSSAPIAVIVDEAEGGPSRRVRRRAIRALGELGNHGAVEALKRLAGDPDICISKAAQRGLQQIGCAAWGRVCAAEALGMIGESEEALHALRGALRDPGHHVRAAAMRALGSWGIMHCDPAAVRILLKDPYEDVRAELALAFQRVQDPQPECVEAAVLALQDSSRLVRSHAARALGRFNQTSATPALIEGLGDPYRHVRRDCRNALMNIGEAVLPFLRDALPEKPRETGKEILQIMKAVAQPEFATELQTIAGKLHDPELAEEARETAQEIGSGNKKSRENVAT